MIEVQEMKYHMPGWTAEVDLGGNRGARFLLWAPNEKRERWAACWQSWEVEDPDEGVIMDGSDDGGFEHGDTMDEVLKVLDSFPNEDLAARVRRLLSGAARSHGY